MIHNTTRLARMILREAHMGPDNLSHRRSPSYVIGRNREYAVLYKLYHLAVSVVKSCPRCMLEEAKTKRIDQKIGEIEVDRLKPSPPFNNVTVDLAGPFRIRYREKKVWALVYLCNNSKALHLQTVESTTAKGLKLL